MLHPPIPLSHLSDPGNRKRKRADESNAAPPVPCSHLSLPGNRKRRQSTATEEKQPKVVRKTADVLVDLIDGGKPDR
eukprot:1796175-Karenia_brevis.AAC.1